MSGGQACIVLCVHKEDFSFGDGTCLAWSYWPVVCAMLKDCDFAYEDGLQLVDNPTTGYEGHTAELW